MAGYNPLEHKDWKAYEAHMVEAGLDPYAHNAEEPIDALNSKSARSGEIRPGYPYVHIHPDGTIEYLTLKPEDFI